jgi:D-aminopeptidase
MPRHRGLPSNVGGLDSGWGVRIRDGAFVGGTTAAILSGMPPPAIRRLLLLTPLVCLCTEAGAQTDARRPRVRDAGVVVGVLPPGPLNAIADVDGVLVGHATVVRGAEVRTGVTAILPHGGNLFREKVPAAVVVGNGFGKLMGSTQVRELGELETPILLTSTLSVPRVADALVEWMLARPGNEDVRSVNPVVAETNDGYLNDGRGRHNGRAEVVAALEAARGGPVEEGNVGAGTGTVAFGFKGGIGTASRRLPASLGGYTVGVLVQSNYGGVLTIAGAPVGQALGRYYLREAVTGASPRAASSPRDRDLADGSIIVVVATDAPVDARNLERLGTRALLGLARTGAAASNGSGDYAMAFSTFRTNRVTSTEGVRQATVLGNESMSPLFLAAIEATEEAIYNSLFRAQTMTGRDGHVAEALPLEQTLEILRRHGAIRR